LSLLDAANNHALANVNMNLQLGLPETTKLILDSTFLDNTQNLKDFAAYENLALQNRKDIQANTIRQRAAQFGIKAAKAEAYPSLAVSGGYVAAYVPGFVTITNAVNVGVGVQYNLASLWKTNSSLQQAKARLVQTEAGEGLLTDATRLEVNRDYQQCLLGEKKIEVYEKAAAQAAENFRITNNKYNNNLVTLTDLLEADVALLQSRLNTSAAKADAVLNYQKLLQTAGLLTK
ncbi:MAG: TolC family protein, partial [Ginsengibacter sp.]